MSAGAKPSQYRKLAICPEHGFSPFLWNRGEGGLVADAGFFYGSEPMFRSLWEGFAAWMLDFTSTAYTPGGFPPDWDWAGFHHRGMALARRLKIEVGPGCEVIYEKPLEDPGHLVDSPVVVQESGSITAKGSSRKP